MALIAASASAAEAGSGICTSLVLNSIISMSFAARMNCSKYCGTASSFGKSISSVVVLFGGPIVVLVESQDLINIASVIRLAKNFLLGQVRLVKPREFDPYRIEGIAHNTADVVEQVGFYETPEAAVIRELAEELNVTTWESCLAPLTFASHGYDGFHLLMPLFVCRKWEGEIEARAHEALK